MNLELYVFYFFSFLLLFSSINVIISNNAVKSAVYLVASFFFSAVLWLILNAEFLSVILILVYVGAVMVLFLFVVMMLDLNVTPFKEGFVKYFTAGLGEMNPEQLWETTLDRANRKLLQVKLEDQVNAERQLIMLMGDDVTDRKNFIQDNSIKVANLDI